MTDDRTLVSQRHYPALDGLRGIAILLVMFVHTTVMVPANPVQSALFEVAQIGWIGVDLFFVLSGFLITGILIDTVGKPGYFSTFYKRRILRIFPLFYLVALFSFVVLPHLPFLPAHKLARFGTVGDDQWMYWTFLSNIAITKVGVFRHGIMDVTWSLSIEEQFYLFWPLVVMLFPKRIIPISLGLIALSIAMRFYAISEHWHYNAVYVFTLCRLDGLAVGAIVATLVRTPVYQAQLRRWTKLALLVGGIVFAGCAIRDGSISFYEMPTVATFGFTSLAVFFGGLLGIAFLAPAESQLASLLSARWLRFIGKISYALYLFHLPIRAALRDLAISPEWIGKTPLWGLSGQLLFYAIAFGVSVLAAWLSYELFEKHFLKLGHRRT